MGTASTLKASAIASTGVVSVARPHMRRRG
jgi:hypothetical protein